MAEAVLAGLEVAVLLVELVLEVIEVIAILKQATLAAAALDSTETGRRCCLLELVELELDEAAALSLPLLSPPVSPLPLEPTGVCGMAQAKV